MPGLVFVHDEQCCCGDEASVCGRFMQNALGTTTKVARENGIPIRCGDHRISEEGSGKKDTSGKQNHIQHIPDFVGVRDSQDLPPIIKILGEGKTFWKHKLANWHRKWRQEGEQGASLIRHALGQVTLYMGEIRIHDHVRVHHLSAAREHHRWCRRYPDTAAGVSAHQLQCAPETRPRGPSFVG
ncbi:uncharacterized protein BDV17DRAFT_229426 [Aspergillus undulatus]|uniref:uncharacterized protein n=1 Tax=Aspergillus undulatus TaxID=1810928 RepID=UPI003CCC9656